MKHIVCIMSYFKLKTQPSQIASHVGPTSAEDRHWSAISADMADIRPTSAAYRDKSAIFADMADTGPTSAEDRH